MHEYLEEIEDTRGYLYYYNKSKNVKYKEHPRLILIIKNIKNQYDLIKFSSYRCACKIYAMQKALFTHFIPFDLVKQILKRHRLSETDDSPLLRPTEVTALVHDIFFAAERMNLFVECKEFDLKNAVSVVSNLIWNCFDQKRSKSISLMEFKLTMLIICELSPNYHDLINEHFNLLKNHNNSVSSIRFESLISIFGKLLSYLGESLYFDSNVIQEIIQACFAEVPGPSGLNNYQFVNLWNISNSNKFSHYTTLFILLIRLKRSESTVHQQQCAKCQVFPIRGMRFKCQRCKNLSLCFDCFTKGFQTKNHTFGHRMLELNTTEQPPRNRLCSFFRKIRKMFVRDNSHVAILNPDPSIHATKFIENDNIQLVHVEDSLEGHPGTMKNRRSEIFNNSENNLIMQKNMGQKLGNLVGKFEDEASEFQKQLELLRAGKSEEFMKFAADHLSFLMEHVNLLKLMGETVNPGQENLAGSSNMLPYSSTPYRQSNKAQQLKKNPSSPLAASIHGAEVNKTYLEENKTDYSVSDLSTWFQTKSSDPVRRLKDLDELKTLDDVALETKMNNFRNLLLKVKEIIDDSYSDNVDLAKTTHELENVLDRIIDEEEKKRVL